MGLLKPIVGGRIRAITWKRDDGGLDELRIIPSARGVQFVKRDEGKLNGLLVTYFYTPTMFGGYRKVVCMPWAEARTRPLRGQQPAVSTMPGIEVCIPIGGIALASAAQRV